MRIQWQLLALSMVLVACDKVPSTYVGNYSDTISKLSIGGGAASFTSQDSSISSELRDLTIAELKKGSKAAYMVADSVDKSMVKIYFVSPNIDTKEEGGGMLWYQSEVAIVAINTKAKGPVTHLNVAHCKDGAVSVDTTENRWQIGCSGNASELDLKRLK
jgi:hypothetical protein